MKYLELKSGTDIRGVASEGVPGQEINLSDEVIKNIAGVFLSFCEQRLNLPASKLSIALGHDSRISANRISSALKEVFVSCGVQVYDCGLASTPSMFMAVLDIPCHASVQITASHHPFNRNGLKFFTKDGGLDSPDITAILELAQKGQSPKPSSGGSIIPCKYMELYCEKLRDMIVRDLGNPQPLSGLHLIVDAGNGAGEFYSEKVLKPLGADTSGSQFLEPDGYFPNHVPNPEDKKAMEAICKATVENRGDLGIIFDTDVDRAGAVGPDGQEINRNALVALASAIAMSDNPGGTIVTDSITSDGLKEYIEKQLGGAHHRFQRGYKNVINEALRLNSLGVNCPLAIETSGHAAMRENYFLDDGAYLITKIIIKLALLRREGKTLNDLLSPLKQAVEDAELRFPISAPDFRPVGESTVKALENYAKDNGWQLADDSREGVRISFDKSGGDGWLLLRLSVHDPIMPLNMESMEKGGTLKLATKLLEFFKYHGSNDIDISCLKQLVENGGKF